MRKSCSRIELWVLQDSPRKKGGHRTPSTKKQRTARAPSTGSGAGVKARLCHLCKHKKGAKCEDGCIAHAVRSKAIVACARHTSFAGASKNAFSRKTILRKSCVKHGAKMCEDDTHNKCKSVRKNDCALCTPSRLCPHGLRTCNKCKPGILPITKT
jgi:hypothetical protein